MSNTNSPEACWAAAFKWCGFVISIPVHRSFRTVYAGLFGALRKNHSRSLQHSQESQLFFRCGSLTKNRITRLEIVSKQAEKAPTQAYPHEAKR